MNTYLSLNTLRSIEKNEADSDLAVQVKAVSLKALNQPKRAIEHFEILFKRKPNAYMAYELADLKIQVGDNAGAEKVIIATGGLSWPKTGCTGDGYRFARSFGHNITQTRASLVPLVSFEDWPGQLAGTAVEDVRISTRIKNKKQLHFITAFLYN